MDSSDQIPQPTGSGLSPVQVENLLAAGRNAFGSGGSSAARAWEPPPVEWLREVLPQYEVECLIARGGMGAVYKGTQKALGRAVAIKVLPAGIDDGGLEFAERFKREAQAMARLSHPNIVPVHDAGETPEGLLYFVMEFVEGTDVGRLLAAGESLAPDRAARMIMEVCEALGFAHQEGIVHRDIKPSNLMIDGKDHMKVADFGLAKAIHAGHTLLTRSDMAMGTPDFVAPEAQLPGAEVDGRADLYSLGVTFYQMLTGRLPRGRFDPPSGVVPRLDRRFDGIVDKALQADREKRYQTAWEMKRDIERALKAKERAGKNTVFAFAISAGVAAVLAVGGWFALRNPEVPVAVAERPVVSAKPAAAVAPASSLFPAPIPGRWVKMLGRPEDARLGNNSYRGVAWQDGWLVPTSAEVFVNQQFFECRDGSVRARFRHVFGKTNGASVKLRGNDKFSVYELRVQTGREVLLTHAVMDPSVEPWKRRLNAKELAAVTLPAGLKHGEEYTLQITMIGDRLQGRFNDIILGPVVDSRASESGYVGVFSAGPVRDIECINLDGVPADQWPEDVRKGFEAAAGP